MRACWDANPDLRPSFPEVNLLLKDQYLLEMVDDDDYSYSTPPDAAPPPPPRSSSPGERHSSRDDMLFAPGSQRNMNYGAYHAPGETDALLADNEDGGGGGRDANEL